MTEAVPIVRTRGPVLLFGGCYSNLQATSALLAVARELRIAADHMICTGDVVAYAADAAATVRAIRECGVAVVQGNCEESLGDSAADCGCGFAKGSTCEQLSTGWYAHADATLDADARAWMRSLPRRIDLEIGTRRLAVVHGTPALINAFVYASAPDAVLRKLIDDAGCDGIIGGHCGIPFSRVVARKLWHNPGAIGMPANDGTARVWYSVLVPHPDHIEIRHEALDYDHAGAAAAMRDAGLHNGYCDALSSGLWPSLDVLPAEERARTGQKLVLPPVFWT